MVQQERNQQETTVISVIKRNQYHQMDAAQLPVEIQGMLPCETGTTARAEQNNASLQRKRCPHHPQARMVRFDPAPLKRRWHCAKRWALKCLI